MSVTAPVEKRFKQDVEDGKCEFMKQIIKIFETVEVKGVLSGHTKDTDLQKWEVIKEADGNCVKGDDYKNLKNKYGEVYMQGYLDFITKNNSYHLSGMIQLLICLNIALTYDDDDAAKVYMRLVNATPNFCDHFKAQQFPFRQAPKEFPLVADLQRDMLNLKRVLIANGTRMLRQANKVQIEDTIKLVRVSLVRVLYLVITRNEDVGKPDVIFRNVFGF